MGRQQAIDGAAMDTRCAMWPLPRAPISSTRYRVSGSMRSTVEGKPISLLKERRLATVGPCCSKMWRSRSLVLVFPAEPVRASTVPLKRLAWLWARSDMAVRTSATTMHGVSGTGCSVIAAMAPVWTALWAWSCPSVRVPRSAANRPPGLIARESNDSGALVRACGSGTWWRVPLVAAAISVRVMGSMGCSVRGAGRVFGGRAAPPGAGKGRRDGQCWVRMTPRPA